MKHQLSDSLSKVPAVTLGFWIIKILATTLGETGGDAVTMSVFHADTNAHNGGYLIGTGMFLVVFVAAVAAQISTEKFNAWVYWLAIVARRRSAPPWRIFSTGHWELATQAARRSFSFLFWLPLRFGILRWAPSTFGPSQLRKSNYFIG